MFAAVGVIVIAVVSVVLARLKPAAPTVERATVWVDTVKRGDMNRNVRGLGTLVPVDEARRLSAPRFVHMLADGGHRLRPRSRQATLSRSPDADT